MTGRQPAGDASTSELMMTDLSEDYDGFEAWASVLLALKKRHRLISSKIDRSSVRCTKLSARKLSI